MFTPEDNQNLANAKQLLFKVSTFNIDDEIEYDAALFNLKRSLELLGTLREKADFDQKKFLSQVSELRNSLIHGIVGLSLYKENYIKPFIRNHVNELADVCEINKLQYSLDSTDLYKKIVLQDNLARMRLSTQIKTEDALAQRKGESTYIELYKEAGEFYVKKLINIDFSINDDKTPTKKAAALNIIFTLGEIAKQVKSHYPEQFSNIFGKQPFLLALAGQERNNLAHANLAGYGVAYITDIQKKLQEQAPAPLSHKQHSDSTPKPTQKKVVKITKQDPRISRKPNQVSTSTADAFSEVTRQLSEKTTSESPVEPNTDQEKQYDTMLPKEEYHAKPPLESRGEKPPSRSSSPSKKT